MCLSAKYCILAWWIAVIISLLLWYRNNKYDRVISAVLFILGLIQLVNYGSHSAVDPKSSGKAIIILLIILLATIIISCYIYTHNTILMWMSISVSLISVVLIGIVLLGAGRYLSFVDKIGECPSWTQDGSPMLGGWIIVYIMIISFCWLVILHSYNYKDVGLYIIASFIIITGFWASRDTTAAGFGPKWTYLLIGIGLIVWLSGLFSEF